MQHLLIAIFLLGYLGIAMEHKIQINKAATALLTAGALWILYILALPHTAAEHAQLAFEHYIHNHPALEEASITEQCISFIVNFQIIESLGEIAETLFFLIGAMTIVELIDVHGGFSIITNHITTRKKVQLLWLLAWITFFMSAVMDNMTTSIVMVMLLRRIIPNYKERWLFASMVVIAANSGGAWSPIGDVTTIMLWVKGNVTAAPLFSSLLLPCIISVVVPLLIISRKLHGSIQHNDTIDPTSTNIEQVLSYRERMHLLGLGIVCLLSVPLLKTFAHLPPFMGIMIGLGVMWVHTELLYKKKLNVEEDFKHRVTRVIRRIDTPTILFFLGILMAVSVLQSTGVLGALAKVLTAELHNVYWINLIIGALSSIVDNVPLVAAAIGMYPVLEPTLVAQMADPAFMGHFVQDGTFWLFLAYCAGVGGSMLIIGSVSGVVVMGIEKITFNWYFKNISMIALLGYLCGAGAFVLMQWLS